VRIAFAVERLGTYQSTPVWGEERLVVSLAKHMTGLRSIESVQLLDKSTNPDNADIVIQMHNNMKHRGKKSTIYWYQNDHEYDIVKLSNQYDGLIFASRYHYDLASRILPDDYPFIREPVVYADPDEFPVLPRTDKLPIVYLGNNIKGAILTRRYLQPALPFGLRAYGTGWENSPISSAARGSLKGMMSTGQLYANSDIVIAFHLKRHHEWNLPVVRATEAILSRSLVISDHTGYDIWGDRILYTQGGKHLSELLEEWVGQTAKIREFNRGSRLWAIEYLNISKQAARLREFFRRLK